MAKEAVRAECRSCGQVESSAVDLRCKVEVRRRSQAICEFRCPFCGGLVLFPAEAWRALALQALGASSMTGPVPFELLEPHRGPAVSWDDVLDSHLALERTDCPQAELVAWAPRLLPDATSTQFAWCPASVGSGCPEQNERRGLPSDYGKDL